MNKPTPPIEEAIIALGGILADEETPCPQEIGDEIDSILVALEEAKRTHDGLVAALQACKTRLGEMDCGPEWEQADALLAKIEGATCVEDRVNTKLGQLTSALADLKLEGGAK